MWAGVQFDLIPIFLKKMVIQKVTCVDSQLGDNALHAGPNIFPGGLRRFYIDVQAMVISLEIDLVH